MLKCYLYYWFNGFKWNRNKCSFFKWDIYLYYIRSSDLEEGLDDTISKLTELFIKGFDNEIGRLINALLNTTIINFANKKVNEYLSSVNCPGIKDPDYSEVDVVKTSAAVGACVGIFLMFIFSPYILCKAFKKKKEERMVEENDINREATISSDINKDEKEPEPRYCIDSISIKWMKEFGRIDPEGASLFLDPRIPLFFRIFLPLAKWYWSFGFFSVPCRKKNTSSILVWLLSC